MMMDIQFVLELYLVLYAMVPLEKVAELLALFGSILPPDS